MLAVRFGVREADFRAQPTRFMSYPSGSCRVALMDGSVVELRWSFALVSADLRAVAVFSEHCGHHVFPLHEATVYEQGVQVYPAIV